MKTISTGAWLNSIDLPPGSTFLSAVPDGEDEVWREVAEGVLADGLLRKGERRDDNSPPGRSNLEFSDSCSLATAVSADRMTTTASISRVLNFDFMFTAPFSL